MAPTRRKFSPLTRFFIQTHPPTPQTTSDAPQNGSDVRGVALAGIESEPVDLSPGNAYYIAKAFALWLAGTTGGSPADLSIAVGRDPRLSGPTLTQACLIGLGSLPGLRVSDCGLASTPACFMVRDQRTAGAVEHANPHTFR